VSAPRANRVGSRCPDWCTTDHAPSSLTTRDGQTFDTTIDGHSSTDDTIAVLAGPGAGGHAIAYAWQSGQIPLNAEPRITIDARSSAGTALLDPTAADALRIAVLVEALAHATPEQHHQLAAQLRAAAGIVTAGETPQ
jgi:hypothetical protein